MRKFRRPSLPKQTGNHSTNPTANALEDGSPAPLDLS